MAGQRVQLHLGLGGHMKPYITMRSGIDPVIERFIARAAGYGEEVPLGMPNTLSFWDKKGLKVALAYNHYTGPNIAIHAAARQGALWCHPAILYHVFAYPFLQLKTRRVTAPVSGRNVKCIEMLLNMGFQHEGTLREADVKGANLLIFGMLKRECRWLDYKEKKVESDPLLIPETAGRC